MTPSFGRLTATFATTFLLGCAGDTSSSPVEPDPGSKDPYDDPSLVVAELGSNATRKFTQVAGPSDGLLVPRDLEFDPSKPDELWIVNLAFEGTVTVYYPGKAQQKAIVRMDGHRAHFMSQVISLAMGSPGYFATCGETGQSFMGPALWPLDTAIYAKDSSVHHGGMLGSHIDMLHQTPKCMGIAHESANVYWVSDATSGNIARYDFRQDHGPGHDDHRDGVIRRYTEATVTRVPYVAGHMALDATTGWLYYADPGGKRIMRLQTKSGSVSGSLTPLGEQIAEYSAVTGATIEPVVTTGVTEPAGLVFHDGKLFVTDHANNDIIAFDISGKLLQRIKTPAQEIMGITRGPDGKLWYVDSKAHTVTRIDR